MTDYSFFEAALHSKRRLREYYGNLPAFMDDEMERFNLGIQPVTVGDFGDCRVIEATSCAQTPGMGVKAIETILHQPLPDDFRDFYTLFAEAVIVTRSRPLHLWPVSKIVSTLGLYSWEIQDEEARRSFRFGAYLDDETRQFALGQHPGSTEKWSVLRTNIEESDKECANSFAGNPGHFSLGDSFRGWLAKFIASDGMNDVFLAEHSCSPGGAAYDPVTSND